MFSLLLIIKSLYTLSIFYFEFPFLLASPLKFCLFLSVFNHFFALFLRLRQERSWRLATETFRNFGIASFLVIVAGGNPFTLNSWAFASLLSSVASFESFEDSELISNLYNLKISSFTASSSSTIKLFATLGSLIGSLLTGLIVILDWDVTWQKFPIPNAIGCIFGELGGALLAGIILNIYKKNNKTNKND